MSGKIFKVDSRYVSSGKALALMSSYIDRVSKMLDSDDASSKIFLWLKKQSGKKIESECAKEVLNMLNSEYQENGIYNKSNKLLEAVQLAAGECADYKGYQGEPYSVLDIKDMSSSTFGDDFKDFSNDTVPLNGLAEE